MRKSDRAKIVKRMKRASLFERARQTYIENKEFEAGKDVDIEKIRNDYSVIERRLIKELASDEGIDEVLDMIDKVVARNIDIVEYTMKQTKKIKAGKE